MSCTQLTDGKISTPIQPTLSQTVGPKGVIYNVPLDIKADEILNYLQPQVKFVKRFQYKPAGELELHDSTTVRLNFQSELPSEVRTGYLLFKIRPYIPKPLWCFKCNQFGHVAHHCKTKERCSKCGEQHSWTVCPSTALNCPNWHGKHAANDKSCPRYKQVEQVLKAKRRGTSHMQRLLNCSAAQNRVHLHRLCHRETYVLHYLPLFVLPISYVLSSVLQMLLTPIVKK